MYEIKLNKTQLDVMQKSLDFYSRFLSGQWRIPDAMQWKEYELNGKDVNHFEHMHHIEDRLNRLSSEYTGLPLHASYGVGSDKLAEESRIAYDMYRPVLELYANKAAEKDPKYWNVYSSPSRAYSKEGRIVINEIKDD